ncbi:DUF881 domain-containing protein [Frankia sp. QA3]|uniref:DUF881 domain-containing protein n=1 Tax=Frankia sp. QA3 TaxID=710111 RepID=UPI000269CAC0|nr:DUF881 domain-containing protein [Frankia sp. QA3]EIV93115.1 hypothetical protein FraQA3DRAFT_2793 [Frankia sp. QA3]
MAASAAKPPRPEPAGEPSAEPVAGAGRDPAPAAAGEPDAPGPADPQPADPQPADPQPADEGRDGVHRVGDEGDPVAGGAVARLTEAEAGDPVARYVATAKPAEGEPGAAEGDLVALGVAAAEPAVAEGEPAARDEEVAEPDTAEGESGARDETIAGAGAGAGAGEAAGGESVTGVAPPAEPGAETGPVGIRLRRVVTLVLLAALGFGGVVAARSAEPSFSLATARPDELAASLGAIGAEDRALATKEGRLRREADSAGTPGASPIPGGASGPAGGRGAASGGGADAERTRADELAILAGTVAVSGPGLELTIRDPHRAVDASVLVDALQELRDAGAEAIEIAGVRAGVSTYVADEPGRGLIVDGTSVAPPYVLRVVGDAHTLDQALRIPGGVLDTVTARDGAQASVRTSEHIEIRALRPAPSPRYARPAG